MSAAIKRLRLRQALERVGCNVVLGVQTIPSAGVNYNADHDTVLAVQKALKAKGYDPGKLDGVFGSKTSSAIKAMQKDANLPQTGDVDYGVLIALQVSAPSSAPRRSDAGISASAAHQNAENLDKSVADEDRKEAQAQLAQAGGDAAMMAQTPAQVQQAAQKVADAAKDAPTAVQQKVAAAKQRAAAARTPAEVAAAKQEVQQAAAAVVSTVKPSFFNRDAFLGLKVWHVGLVGVGLAAVTFGIAGLFGGRRGSCPPKHEDYGWVGWLPGRTSPWKSARHLQRFVAAQKRCSTLKEASK